MFFSFLNNKLSLYFFTFCSVECFNSFLAVGWSRQKVKRNYEHGD